MRGIKQRRLSEKVNIAAWCINGAMAIGMA